MKRVIAAVALVVLLLAVVLVVRALRATSRQVVVTAAPRLDLDAQRLAEGLAGAIRFRTISHQDPAQFDGAPFRELRDYLAARFPHLHRVARREMVNEHSLLYTWPGGGAGAPLVLLAHLDVVPVEPGTERDWLQPPFGGVIVDGFIWGRGALDDKASALAILEAAEVLAARGWQPPRDLIFAFGHDEEISGRAGAQAMAALLRERGVAPELIIDEGTTILQGIVPGITAPVASIGIAEKGYVSLELTTQLAGGHSSLPPRRTAIGVLSQAVTRLQENPVPGNLDAAVARTFDYLGPEMGFPLRLVFANLWLFSPLVERQLGAAPQTNAAMRTTTAPTIFQGGTKENQLPVSARAVVNFRILPGDTVESVVAHVRRTIDDPAVAIGILGEPVEPSAVSPADGPVFAALTRTIRATNPDVVVAPVLVLGATDARHYTGLTPHVYRFTPVRTAPDDLPRYHGTNERIGIDAYADMVRFYVALLQTPPGGHASTTNGRDPVTGDR